MSVVIIGGHDRMVSQYKKICKNYKCKAKVFTQMSASMDKQIGRPDLLVLFTNTVSHKMIKCALDEVDASQTEIVRCHTSSGTALTEKPAEEFPPPVCSCSKPGQAAFSRVNSMRQWGRLSPFPSWNR